MTAATALPADLIDSLLSGYKKSEDLFGENDLLKQLTKALEGEFGELPADNFPAFALKLKRNKMPISPETHLSY
jgi:hypothetical protein